MQRVARPLRLLVLLALGFLALPDVGWAQEDFQVDSTATCPSFESEGNKRLLRRAAWSFVAARDVDLLVSVEPRARRVDVRLSRAFEGVRLLTFHRRADGSVLMFAQFPESRICGWIPADQVFQSECLFADDGRFDPLPMRAGPRALRSAEVDERLGATCSIPDGKKGLIAKVVLHNINKTEDEEESDGVRLYLEPGLPMEEADGKRFLKVADSFHIFDAAQRDEFNRETNQTDRITYYLIGRRDVVSSFDQTDRFLMQGWVRDKDIFVWSTRYAAFWSGRAEALGYKEPAVALEEPDKWVAKSAVNVSPPADSAPNAMPLLEETDEDGDLSKRLVRLVVRGGCASAEANCASGTDLEEERRKLVERLNSLARVDVLFLLDGSRSMDTYFDLISDMIPQVSEELAKETSGTGQVTRSIRVAVAAYGDYTGGRSSLETLDYRMIYRFADIKDPTAVRRLQEALAKERTRNPTDKEGDLREASFAAVSRAAQTEGWRADAAFQVVVHLADHGNRDFGKTSEEYEGGKVKSSLIESISAKTVIDTLCKAGIYYAPVAVQGSTYNETANEAFVRQAGAFKVSAGQSCALYFFPPKVTYSGKKTEAIDVRKDKIRNGIKGVFATTTELAQDLLRSISCIEGGGSVECLPVAQVANPEDDDWSVAIREGVTKEFGFDEVQLRNLYGRAQPSLALYYFIQNQGRELFDYYIAMSLDDLRVIKDTYQELCDNAKASSITSVEMRDALVEVVETASGDRIEGDDEGVREFLDRINKFPARHLHAQNNFLAQDWPQVSELLEYGQPDERRQYSKAVCRTALLLRHVFSGKETDLAQLTFVEGADESFGYWEAPQGALKDYTWDVPSISGIGLYFVPLGYFMYTE